MSHMNDLEIFDSSPPTILAGESEQDLHQTLDMKCEMRSSKKQKNLGYHQRMPATLDQDLRKYFGFGKKQFKNIVKKPGNKFGFKLSNYIHPSDSVAQVNEILRAIAMHMEYTKASPVKVIFHKNFKDELRAKFFARKPEEYLVNLHFGATFKYDDQKVNAEGKKICSTKVDTNRGIHMNEIIKMSPTDMKNFTQTYPRLVFEYHGVLLSDYQKGVGGIGPHKVLGDTSYVQKKIALERDEQEKIPVQMIHDEYGYDTKTRTSMIDIFMNQINTGGYGDNLLDIWLEAPPIIIQKTKFTADQFIEDELMERASVLSDNFLKHAC